MNAMTVMADMEQRLDAVNRVHQVLNARRELTPMAEDSQTIWFMACSFAVLCLLGIAALL